MEFIDFLRISLVMVGVWALGRVLWAPGLLGTVEGIRTSWLVALILGAGFALRPDDLTVLAGLAVVMGLSLQDQLGPEDSASRDGGRDSEGQTGPSGSPDPEEPLEPEASSAVGGPAPVDSGEDPQGPHLCERCGHEMFERHCKILCPSCGLMRDCSDN